jgi:hypothetical protein
MAERFDVGLEISGNERAFRQLLGKIGHCLPKAFGRF